MGINEQSPYSFRSVTIKGTEVVGRPIEWDQAIVDNEGHGANGNIVVGVKFEGICPFCGQMVHFGSDVLQFKCPECKAGTLELIQKAEIFVDPGEYIPTVVTPSEVATIKSSLDELLSDSETADPLPIEVIDPTGRFDFYMNTTPIPLPVAVEPVQAPVIVDPLPVETVDPVPTPVEISDPLPVETVEPVLAPIEIVDPLPVETVEPVQAPAVQAEPMTTKKKLKKPAAKTGPVVKAVSDAEIDEILGG